jgi:mannose-1-phosphate guanylyltransferase
MTSSAESRPLWALVMAGGSGTRFWPLSRATRPKQLLRLAEGRSLLAATVDRLPPLVPPERILVVTNEATADAVRSELPHLPPTNVLAEPIGRDTAACVGWIAWRLQERAPGAVMAVVPADHLVPDGPALRRSLASAAAIALVRGGLVTIALRPTRPETGFGYLELAPADGAAGELPVHRVVRFVEKPDRERAEAFLAAGNFRWNSGMFAWTVRAIGDELRRHLPELAEGLDRLIAETASLGEDAALRRNYPGLPRVSVDFGVMERASCVWAVEADFAWSDIGSWPALEDACPGSAAGVTLGDVSALECEHCVLISDGPLIAAVGVHDLVVVATKDAVLVVPRDQSQRVKELVERLRAAGRGEIL